MSDNDDRLLVLLVAWEEKREAGTTLTPEELCPDDPALQGQLRERIRKRLRLHEALGLLGGGTPAVDRSPAIPQVPGYEILDVIGHGGMGVVYRARHVQLNRVVALKMIRAADLAAGSEVARFRDEAEAVAALHHPNIVQIYEVGDCAGRPYLTLEYVPGGSLAQSLNGTPLPPARAAALVETLARAAHHAHERGFVHRDLKPANVLLTSASGNSPVSGNDETLPVQHMAAPKIADFGLARRIDATGGHTQTGAVIGSPSYMAPEQAHGRGHDVGPGTDVYALGTILYECLTGRPPFIGATVLETLDLVRSHDPVPPRDLVPAVPRDLETVCLKCLEKEPARRYASARDLADDLRRFLNGESVTARQVTVLEQIARTISQTSFDAPFRAWSTSLLVYSPVPLLLQLMVFAAARHRPDYAAVAIGAAMTSAVIGYSFVVGWNRKSLRLVPPRVRRNALSVWTAMIVGLLWVPIVVGLVVRSRTDPALFAVFPLWMVTDAMSTVALSHFAGPLYLLGAAKLATAVLAALWPPASPLIVTAVVGIDLVLQGVMLRHMPTAAGVTGATAATTTSR